MFFRGTIFAYDSTVGNFRQKVEAGFIDDDKVITHTLSSAYPYDFVARDPANLEERFKKSYPPYLHELLLVKLISILEVFFSDITREVLVERRDILKQIYFRRRGKGDEKSFPRFSNIQLLSLKSISSVEEELINYESRAISNKSFLKLEKYFRENLQIDFKRFAGDKKSLEKTYHMRNLLVHRLGKTDLDYRLSSKTNQAEINVSRKFLLRLVALTQEFVDFVSEQAELLISHQETPDLRSIATCIADITAEPLSTKGVRMLQRDYRFIYDDQLFLLGDLLHGYLTNENLVTLTIRGKVREVRAYRKTLKRSEEIRLVDVSYKRYIGKNKTYFPSDFLWELDRALPDPPYSDQQIDELTNVLGMKRRNVRRIFDFVEAKKSASEEMLAAVGKFLQEVPMQKGIHELIAQELDIDLGLSYKLVGFVRHRHREEGATEVMSELELPSEDVELNQYEAPLQKY